MCALAKAFTDPLFHCFLEVCVTPLTVLLVVTVEPLLFDFTETDVDTDTETDAAIAELPQSRAKVTTNKCLILASKSIGLHKNIRGEGVANKPQLKVVNRFVRKTGVKS